MKTAAPVLDESEDEGQGAGRVMAVPSPTLEPVAPQDAVGAALVKLTALVEDLQANKVKRGSRLEQALDGISGG